MDIILENKMLIACMYLLFVIGISIVMFANSIKRRSTVGVILSVLNISIPFIPLIIYIIKVNYEKKIHNKNI